MKITESKQGISVVRNASVQELKQLALDGSMEAIRDLIYLKGGYSSLTAAQKDKVILLILGFNEDL